MKKFSHEQELSISQIGGLVLVNAFIFQEALANSNPKVKPLNRFLNNESFIKDICQHWLFITKNINYYPIFHIANEILENLTSDSDLVDSIKNLADTALEITRMRAPLRHDLMGRIYHKLLVEAKYLGTYYTSISAATILLRLALDKNLWNFHWGNIDELRDLTVADLACGTGTLLVSAADAISNNYISDSIETNSDLRIDKLQNILAEEMLRGYDVLPSAIHLTASTLALRAPQIAFTKMNLFCMPLGGEKNKLGSIEFLRGFLRPMQDLFGSSPKTNQISGDKEYAIDYADLPPLDLCVMNPPFTRSVGGNLLFGSIPEKDRKTMQKDLKKLVKETKLKANITAGLGAVFVGMANFYIKRGGRIALVLPKALLSGIAWQKTRDLLSTNYFLEYIISSQDPQKWNFSESTSLSEIMLIAKKKEENQRFDEAPTTIVNLWRNPDTSYEALSIANEIIEHIPSKIEEGQGSSSINVSKKKIGEYFSINLSHNKINENWILPCAFSQIELIRFAYNLLNGNFIHSCSKKTVPIKLKALKDFGTFGPDRRDIYDGFRPTDTKTSYYAFWGHKTEEVITIDNEPNKYLEPLNKSLKNRNLRKVEDLWPLAGKILISERVRLNKVKVFCQSFNKNLLSNVWWSYKLLPKYQEEVYQKCIALFMNSTVGIILLLASRVETEGSWIDFKKPILENYPIMNLDSVDRNTLEYLSSIYNQIRGKEFKVLKEINRDETRREIDIAISRVLGIPEISHIRETLAREPILTLIQL